MIESVTPVRVLTGHTNEDTAYLVNDYPYGYRLRCQIRYWIETGTKGTGKGRQRFMSQTTNPKVDGTVWNKAKGSTYTGLAWMYLNAEDHVDWIGADIHIGPVEDARLRLMGIHEVMTDSERCVYDVMVAMSRKYAPPWDEFEEKVNAVAAHIREHGEDPTFENGTWQIGNLRRYMGSDYDLPVLMTMARKRVAEEGK